MIIGLRLRHPKADGDQIEESRPNRVAALHREEFADVLSYLLDLANYFQIDLEKAFREKEQINQNRTWE